MNLEGWSMRALTLELERELIGGRVDKITQQSRSSQAMTIRQPGRSLFVRLSINPQNPSIYIAERTAENLPEPPTFCMVLRKNLENGRIAGVRQLGLDRVIMIDIDTMSTGRLETFTLALELVGKYSNVILIKDGMIVDALKKIGANSSRVRTVLPNQEYVPPPDQGKLNLFDATDEQLDEIAARLERESPMKFLQGFGPQTTRELLFRAENQSFLDALIELKTIEPEPTLIVDEHDKVLAMSSIDLKHMSVGKKIKFETMSAMLEAADRLIGSYVPPDRDVFNRLIRNELRRATNKIEILRAELEASEAASDWKVMADNLSTYRYEFKDHADDEIEVDNIYDGARLRIKLDRKLTIAANVQAFYRKYDKLKRGVEYIEDQLAKCAEEIKYLETIEHSLTTASTLADIDEIRAELISGGYLKQNHKRAASSKKSQPIRLTAPDGTEILVGKNNTQNDLIRQAAAPTDLWLHTKDIPGSHVILKCGALEPSEETLIFAAEVAAYYSQARGSSKVPVDYIECRRIKKPSGSRAGFVVFTGQRTIFVTPDTQKIFEPKN